MAGFQKQPPLGMDRNTVGRATGQVASAPQHRKVGASCCCFVRLKDGTNLGTDSSSWTPCVALGIPVTSASRRRRLGSECRIAELAEGLRVNVSKIYACPSFCIPGASSFSPPGCSLLLRGTLAGSPRRDAGNGCISLALHSLCFSFPSACFYRVSRPESCSSVHVL